MRWARLPTMGWWMWLWLKLGTKDGRGGSIYNRKEKKEVEGGDDRGGIRMRSGTRYTVVFHVQGFQAVSNK